MKAPQWIKVTPAIATEWLETNTCNRKLYDGVVEKYSRDMVAGDWKRNPEPIIFSNGELVDGQHRLWSVVLSGCTVEFFVHFELDEDARLCINTGRPRDLVDNIVLSGYKGFINKQALGTVMLLHFGREAREKPLSGTERFALVRKYEAHLKFSENAAGLRKRGVAPAPVRAAVARAHMHLGDNSRLVEFCSVLGSGIPQDAAADRAALAFRNYMLEIKVGHKLDPRDTFLKAMNAIDYFVRRKALTVIKVVKEEAYPLKGAEPKPPDLPRQAKQRLAAMQQSIGAH